MVKCVRENHTEDAVEAEEESTVSMLEDELIEVAVEVVEELLESLRSKGPQCFTTH